MNGKCSRPRGTSSVTSFPRSHLPVSMSLENTLRWTAAPSGVMYATQPFLDHAIFLKRVMGVHERNIMFDDHSLTAAICAKFINSSSQTLHRWYSSDILKVDMFRVAK